MKKPNKVLAVNFLEVVEKWRADENPGADRDVRIGAGGADLLDDRQKAEEEAALLLFQARRRQSEVSNS